MFIMPAHEKPPCETYLDSFMLVILVAATKTIRLESQRRRTPSGAVQALGKLSLLS